MEGKCKPGVTVNCRFICIKLLMKMVLDKMLFVLDSPDRSLLISSTREGWRMAPMLLYDVQHCLRDLPFEILSCDQIYFQSFVTHIWFACWAIALMVDKMIPVQTESFLFMNTYLTGTFVVIFLVCILLENALDAHLFEEQ